MYLTHLVTFKDVCELAKLALGVARYRTGWRLRMQHHAESTKTGLGTSGLLLVKVACTRQQAQPHQCPTSWRTVAPAACMGASH